ncbi:hypothetical protein N3K66_002889 [Trichothecium roseum]|uniref:Uncharacterized protein n=1 Tax=Trichothecium roseum TaxID=47278 RepID=A0ACC0V6H3_9HYPO|nr:hypothetical protein N3K66_002889 [Trichothecium roseum]
MGPYGLGFPHDDLPNNGWKLYVTSLVMIVTSGLFVLARVSTRVRLGQLGKDDIAITISWVSALSVSILMQMAVGSGYGVREADLEKTDLRRALRYFFFAQTPYKVTVGLNKLAAVALYLRIFPSAGFRLWSLGAAALVVAWSVASVGATVFQCVPIRAAWDRSAAEGATCIDSASFWVAYAVMNVLTDVLVLVLPIPPLVKLQMGWRSKVMLLIAFGFGIVVTVTSILRTTSVSNSVRNKADITWNFIDRGMWTLIEANLGIVAACLPALQKPLGAILPWLFATTKTTTSTTGTSRRSARRRGRDSGQPVYGLANLERNRSEDEWRFVVGGAGEREGDDDAARRPPGSKGSGSRSVEKCYGYEGSDVDLRIAAVPIDGSATRHQIR